MECIALWCDSAEEDSPEHASALDSLIDDIGWEGQAFVYPDGDKAIEALIDTLRAGQRDGLESSIAEILDERGWKPETDEQRASYLLAKGDTEALLEWGEAVIDILIKLLGKGNAAAAEALGAIGNARAVEPLIEALGENSNVCGSAAKALGAIGDARAVEPLIKVLGVKWPSFFSPWVRENAVEALGKIGKPAVEPLTKALSDDEEWVRDAAKEALKKLGHEVR
jgi:HEAT repeat protein